jgi:N-acetylneuraminate lyase
VDGGFSSGIEECGMTRFYGILPAVVTPVDDYGRFLPSSFEQLLERLYSTGVHGIYVCGQTGEGLALPVCDRKAAAEAAVRNSPPGAQVVVHVGSHRTEDAIELARHAGRAGAHAVSSLPPSGAYSFKEVREYYHAVAAAGDLPFLVYFFPDICPAIRGLDEILELCSLPNVIGLKFTDFNLFHLDRIKRGGFTLYNGRDEILAGGLLFGADGGIGTFYNLVPDLFVEIFEAARAGDWPCAMEAQQRINELIEVVLRFPALAAVKRMLTWSGIPCGDPLAPRLPMNGAEERRLIQALDATSFAGAPFTRP